METIYYDYMSSAAHVEIGAFKAIYGRLTRDPEYVIIVFRGTNSIANLKTDVNQSLADLTANANKIGYGCKVHEGFLEGYKGSLRAELRSKFSTFLKERVNDDGVKKIVISGHSLGGALATLYAYDFGVYLKSENHGFNNIPKLYLVTFGSPRVGDECFRKVINEKLDLTANARFVYKEDSITSLPYKQPYVHVGTEYNFVNYEKFVVKKFNADESARVTTFTGAIYTLAKKIKDHLKYKNTNKSKLVHAIENNVDSLQKKKTRLRKS